MASGIEHQKHCEPCQQRKKKVKVRSFCHECQELLCKDCSDIHLTFKISRNHNLIDLIPLTKKSIKRDPDAEQTKSCDDEAELSSDFVDDELSSDFLEHITLTNDSVLYKAQVAEDHEAASDSLESLSEALKDPNRLKANKILDFETRKEDDKGEIRVTGVVSLLNNVLVVATDDKMKFFDQNGKYISSKKLSVVSPVFAITLVQGNTFAACGTGTRVQICTYDGELREDKTYKVDHLSNGVCFNGSFYSLLHRTEKVVTILDSEGTTVRKVAFSSVSGNLGSDIHMDKATNYIYVPCQQKGIICKTIEGETLWMKSFPQTYTLWGIVELHGVLCIAHDTNRCLELMTKNGIYIGTLIDDQDMRSPTYLHFCEQTNKLYVTHGRQNSDRKDRSIVSIYKIENCTI